MHTLDVLEKIGRAELVLDYDDLESMIPGPEIDEAVLGFYDDMASVTIDSYIEEDQDVESELAEGEHYDEDELTIPKDFLKLKDYKSPDNDTEPVKKLKRDLRMEALRRLEQSARTVADFKYLTECYDLLEANARRRERYHEILRSGDDLSFESGAAEDSTNLPYFMSDIIAKKYRDKFCRRECSEEYKQSE